MVAPITQTEQVDTLDDRRPAGACPLLSPTDSADTVCQMQKSEENNGDGEALKPLPQRNELESGNDGAAGINVDDHEGTSSMAGSSQLTTERHVQELGDKRPSISSPPDDLRFNTRAQHKQSEHDQTAGVELTGDDQVPQDNPTLLDPYGQIISLPSEPSPPVPPCPPSNNRECDLMQLHHTDEKDVHMSKTLANSTLDDSYETLGVTSTTNTFSQTAVCDTETDMNVEDEDEEENWADLTDDEMAERSVEDCVGSIFFDDENDERHCQLCE